MPTNERNTKSLLLLMLMFTFTVNLFAQDYSYVNYDTRDGLAGSLVYDVIQDKEGFMWFATENGLSRFDGKNFTTFTTKDGLPDNEILKLFVDSKGRLWIMAFKPSLSYYFKGKIYNKNNDSLLSKISLTSYAFDMAEDKWGNLFVAEETRWHTISKDKTVKTSENEKKKMSVNALGIDKMGEVELLIETWSNKHRYSIYSPDKNLEIFKAKPDWPEISKSLITPDYVIIPTQHSTYLTFYKDSLEVCRTKLPPNTTSINYIDTGKVIINTRNGMKFFDPQRKIFSSTIFADISFTSAFEDKENNLWLATSGSGVLMIPSFQFINFSFRDDKSNPEITALTIDSNSHIVYTGGWSGKVRKANIDDLRFTVQRTPSAGKNVNKIISILPVNNRLLISTSSGFTNPFTGKESAFAVKSVQVGRSGLIIATHVGVYLCKRTGEQEVIWEGRTTCAVEKDSGFYIGTINGLYYKTLNGQIIELRRISPVYSSRIVNLAVSNDGILWVTTKGNGIAGYVDSKLLYHFTQADGLTSDNCTSLYVDGNIIWLGTEKGLNRIQLTKVRPKITHFSMSDGLPSNAVNAIAALGNKVFVGTPKGLAYFEVDKISQKSTCDLQLTGIYVANKYWCYDSTNFSLPHKSNDVRFEYSGISFKSSGDMTYKYRLLGLQPEWRTTTEDQLSFPSLSSGEYTLQLKAINKYGVQSSVKEVSFVIEKLLWEKTWFRIAVALLFAGGVWAYVAYRIMKVRQNEKEKTQINNRIAELEQKALRSQMNPHFIFNCLNSIQQYVGERDITGANNFITDFSRLIRMTLDLSTYPLINLSDEVDYVNTYLRVERARLEHAFEYCINIDESLDLREVHLPPLLLQPYVENCIRHGVRYKTKGAGLVQLNIRKKNQGVLITVEDNGIGREAARKYKSEYHIQYQSRGMSINEERINMLNATSDKKIELNVTDLYDSEKRASGTRVDIYLP